MVQYKTQQQPGASAEPGALSAKNPNTRANAPNRSAKILSFLKNVISYGFHERSLGAIHSKVGDCFASPCTIRCRASLAMTFFLGIAWLRPEPFGSGLGSQ